MNVVLSTTFIRFTSSLTIINPMFIKFIGRIKSLLLYRDNYNRDNNTSASVRSANGRVEDNARSNEFLACGIRFNLCNV